MRLALVFTGCFRAGGVERIVWESARHLSRRHDVTVLADYWEDCGAPGVRYEKVSPWRRPWTLKDVTFRLRAAAAVAGRFDRVLSYGANCPSGDVLWVNSVHRAWLERKRGGVLRSFHPRHRILLSLEKRLFRTRPLGRVVAVSEQVAEDLARLYGVPRHEVLLVPNGYSPDEFSPERRLAFRDEARAAFGFADDDVVLLMVANELRRKGYDVLVEAVAQLDDPRVRVLLVGRAAPSNFPAELVYAGPLDDVGFAHAAADLFVLPTRYEAACLAIVEALASGLPVITTDVPGAGDRIAHGENGLLQTDPHDAAELVALLREALAPERRAAWAAAAPASVADLAWPALIDRFEKEAL